MWWKDLDGAELFRRSEDDSDARRGSREERSDRESYKRREMRGQKALPNPAEDLSLRLRAVKVELLITAFASEICRGVNDTAILEDVRVKSISKALPRLLKEFSQELVAVSKPGTQKDATKFVCRYRKYSRPLLSVIFLLLS